MLGGINNNSRELHRVKKMEIHLNLSLVQRKGVRKES
jgi:hypothetical protein